VPDAGSTSPLPSPQRGGGASRQTKTDVRLARCAERVAVDEELKAESLQAELEAKGAIVTRRGLAAVLKVSVRTVDEMVAAEEITPLRVRGLVRFFLPDVVRQLTAAAVARLEKLKEDAKARFGLPTTNCREETQGTERTKGT